MRGCSLLEDCSERQKESEFGGQVKWKRTGRSEGRGNYNQNIFYEKIIFFQLIKNLLKIPEEWNSTIEMVSGLRLKSV